MNTGEKIKQIRLEKGMTQKELAIKLNVSPPAISQFEKKQNLELETIKKIAIALEVPYTILFEEVNDKGIVMFESGKDFDNHRNYLISKIRKNELNKLFDQLNERGQDKAIEQVEMLTKIEEYTKK